MEKQPQILDEEPSVGNDPMDPGDDDAHKTIIAPDAAKVREADRRKERQRQQETPEEEAERIKNA